MTTLPTITATATIDNSEDPALDERATDYLIDQLANMIPGSSIDNMARVDPNRWARQAIDSLDVAGFAGWSCSSVTVSVFANTVQIGGATRSLTDWVRPHWFDLSMVHPETFEAIGFATIGDVDADYNSVVSVAELCDAYEGVLPDGCRIAAGPSAEDLPDTYVIERTLISPSGTLASVRSLPVEWPELLNEPALDHLINTTVLGGEELGRAIATHVLEKLTRSYDSVMVTVADLQAHGWS